MARAIAVTLLLFVVAPTQTTPSDEAKTYLLAALDILQQNAMNRSRVDWESVRRDALAKAGGAQTTADTYDAIRFAVAALQDSHSSLMTPASLATLSQPAAIAAMEPTGSAVDGSIAHLVVPAFLAQSQDRNTQYASALMDVIKRLDDGHPCGWIVDLRANHGGNMWPMLAGLGPLLDSGSLGAFADAAAVGPAWSYHDGASWLGGRQMAHIDGDAYLLQQPHPPIAVLLGHTTASSGEAVAIAFRGAAGTRLFGEPTRGLTTANASYKLRDGAVLNVTAAVDVDRTGRKYADGLTPDESTAARDNEIPKTAIDWLRRQPLCVAR